MEWSNSKALELINEYRSNECLWNPADDNHKDRIKKMDAWNKIAKQFNCEADAAKKKWSPF